VLFRSFRELLQGCKRANVIVITKCPQEISAQIKFSIESRLRRYSQSPVFFSKIAYQKLQTINGLLLDDTQLHNTAALVVTGIAKPQPLLSYLKPLFKKIDHLSYRDHHNFRSEEHTSELQSRENLVCRLLLEK